MRVLRLIIHNIGMIENMTVELNKPLVLFYGDIRQGKTTILNSVKYAMGAPWPTDIIRRDAEEASVSLEFENGSVSRSWYVSKDGSTKARSVKFIRDGKAVEPPMKEIEKLMNPFLLDDEYLKKMTELERRQYFVQLFNVDTKEFDDFYAKCETEAKDLRSKIKGYGEIDLTPYQCIDVEPLMTELNGIRSLHDKTLAEFETINTADTVHNTNVSMVEKSLATVTQEIEELEKQLAVKKEKKAEKIAWLSANPPRVLGTRPIAPDTTSIESAISQASANDVRVEQYRKNIARNEEKKNDQARLLELEQHQRDTKKAKAETLASIVTGIPALKFDEDGNFIYQDTTAGMLSTSQIMQLSSELSALYPEGFSLELVDRGESLGRSIFDYVKHAEDKKITVMATVVGSKPADVPDRVGVFVVQDGMIFKDERRSSKTDGQ